MPRPGTSVETPGIASVLKSTKLEVPLHQRSFEWTEQVEEFLEDVGGAFSSNREDYFLGSLVVISAPEPERPKVLDGQQRLAVVSLLLAEIANRCGAIGDKKRCDQIRGEYLFKYDILDGTEHPQLKLNSTDDIYFRSILKGGAVQPEQGAPESHDRLWEAVETITSWITKKISRLEDPINWLARFTIYLTNSAYVIYFVVDDDANAFLIFETMNDRGLDLSIADLLKNYLLGHAGEDLNTVLNLWTSAIACLNAYGGEYIFTVFLRHFWSSKHGLVREKELYKNIKSRVSTKANVVDFANELARNSDYYAAILSPEHDFWSEFSTTACERVRTLALLGLEQYRPMLLSTLAHFRPNEVEDILRLLISWNVRLLIVGGLGGGAMENQYCALAQAIRKGDLKSVKEIAKRAKSFIPNDAIFREGFESARVSKPNLARYYLRTLERQASTQPQLELIANTDPNELTLEHILPQRPKDDSWHKFDEDDRKAYTNRLGNMVLLAQKMNSKLRSAPFQTKREFCANSELSLTKMVASYTQWDKKAIDKRQKYMAELAVKAWNLNV